ncbi:MAG: chromosome segregation protein SMC [Candidatus Thermoplasmatota archaeon]|nr:chromosome segregation protein SMC [Candidatus Thermoplasmatota archaeon]
MYLKEVYMKNFKSFGKQTIVVKLSQGLTVVSGPNGSGKSNISDALLFVVGGQRTKKLRADNYAGLIFDGGKKGKGAKSAEVKLIFSNDDRKINVDSDLVEFTKKIKQKGKGPADVKTYYYINGRSSSRGEFHNIFSVARLSSDGYNVVQQGTVNDIADSTPKQRRGILDDMAGITSLDEALNKSNKRKEKVKKHLDELDAVVGEIDRHLRQLKRERNGALRYRKFEEELAKAKATLAFARKQALEASIENIHGLIKGYKEEIRSSRQEIEKLAERKKELGLGIVDLARKMDEMGDEESKKLIREIQDYQLNLLKAKDRKENAKETRAELEVQLEQYTADIAQGEKEFSKLISERDKLTKRLNRDKLRFEKADGEFKELSDSMKDSSNKFLKLQDELIKLKKELETTVSERHSLAMEDEALNARITRHLGELGDEEDTINNLMMEVRDIKWRLDEKAKLRLVSEKKRKKLSKRQSKARAEIVALRDSGEAIEKVVSRLNQEYQRLRVKRSAADEMGYGRAVKMVLKAGENNKLPGIHGTIAQLARVDEEYELALSTAAGGGMQGIVTKNDASASAAIEFLKKRNYGRATFLPLNKMTGGRAGGKALMVADKPGVIGFAMDLVEYDERYRNAFWYVFGDTLVVKDLEAARQYMGGVRLVTLDGQLIERRGAMTGGSRLAKLIKFGKKDDARYGEVRKELDDAATRQEEITGKIKEQVENFTTIGDEISRITMDMSRVDGDMSALEVNLREYSNRLERMTKEKTGVTDNISGLRDEQTVLGEKMKKKDELIRSREKTISKKENYALKVVPAKLKAKMEKLKEDREKLLESNRGIEARLEGLTTKIEIYEERLGEMKETKQATVENMVKQEEASTEADEEITRLSKEVEMRRSVSDKLDEKIREIKQKIDRKNEEQREVDRKRNELTVHIEGRKSYIIGQNAALSDHSEKLGEIMVKISRYDSEIEGPYPSQDELKYTIMDSKKKMGRLEPVNMVALEIYDREKKRKDDITEKYDKLVAEEKSLTRMVVDVKKKKKEKLMEVFENIDLNFKEIYPKICRNGEGYLHLENKDEPFEGGLIIRARPPGKKMRDIRYLSGGEKSQVAIAFILALQRYDPSPFYVLDEVDQNLDMVNSEVIAKMIKKNSASAQFIMISLHKIIMNFADHLYACYIKDGISRMVAIQNIQDIPSYDEDEKDNEDISGKIEDEKALVKVEKGEGEGTDKE